MSRPAERFGVADEGAAYFGRAIRVFDGDTFLLLVGGENRYEVRLAGIDAPELAQPWGPQAREALAERVLNKRVRVLDEAIDRYGRTVARVWVSGLEVGERMVRRGHAWAYRSNATGRALRDLETEARNARRGLWGLPEAERVPPWAWRHANR